MSRKIAYVPLLKFTCGCAILLKRGSDILGKIVAIGGGDVGRHGTSYETGAIDRAIVRLSDRERPHFLFVGIAKRNAAGYFCTMRDIYGGMYGCETDILTSVNMKIPMSQLQRSDGRI